MRGGPGLAHRRQRCSECLDIAGVYRFCREKKQTLRTLFVFVQTFSQTFILCTEQRIESLSDGGGRVQFVINGRQQMLPLVRRGDLEGV